MFGKCGRKGFWLLSSFTIPSFHNVEVLNEAASLSIVPYGKHSYNLTSVKSVILKNVAPQARRLGGTPSVKQTCISAIENDAETLP